jgi:hypothetical protein
MADYLTQIVADRTLVYVCWGIAFLLGVITCSLVGKVRDILYDRRFEREEEEAEYDSTRILAGVYPDRDDTVDNEEYFRMTTNGKGYRLNEKWRQLVTETRPRSPELMAEQTYHREAQPQEVARILTGQRPVAPIPAVVVAQRYEWPTWDAQERTVAGRHRQDRSALDALRTPTQEWSVLNTKELVAA